MPTCPECLASWDGKTPHMFGGRESSRLTCFGPKAWRKKIPTKTLSEALPKAQADMIETEKKRAAISKRSKVLEQYDQAKAKLGHTPTFADIGKQLPESKPKRINKRTAAFMRALDLLEHTGAVVKASTLPKPSDRQSAGTRAQSASGRDSKGNRRTAGRGTDRR